MVLQDLEDRLHCCPSRRLRQDQERHLGIRSWHVRYGYLVEAREQLRS